MTSSLRLMLAFFLLPACLALRILAPASHTGTHMPSPRARFWGGPPKFSMNTSLVDPGLRLRDCCAPIAEAKRLELGGKTALVRFGSYAEGCDLEDAYLRLVAAALLQPRGPSFPL